VGAETIVGRTGVALAASIPMLRAPRARSGIEGEIWAARSAEPIEPGAAVVVSAMNGLVLDVEPDRRS
jgi:membrane protein implicated in regulation of membrane protease activity